MSINPEEQSTVQRLKYEDLYRRIGEALSKGHDFECVGAEQIALLRWRTELAAKRVYNSKEPYPYRRRGNLYTLSYNDYLRWEAYLTFCGVHGLDPRREAHKYGFGPPPAAKANETKDDATAAPSAGVRS